MKNFTACNFARNLDPTTDPERGLPCVVRHPDAGGRCARPATMHVFGLAFCGIHGEELVGEASPADAYPDASEGVRANVRAWEADEGPNRGAVASSLRHSLETVGKLMRVAYEDGETWLVELLELQRESVAAQAAYASRDGAGDRPTG